MGISIHAPPRGATLQAMRAEIDEAFQFTPLREGRPYASREAVAAIEFQFTPLREGRRPARRMESGTSHFNSRPSARGDPGACPSCPPLRHFNSRPSARGDRKRFAASFICALFQFTPLREGRHRGCPRRHACADISIHAPPRGATRGSRSKTTPF